MGIFVLDTLSPLQFAVAVLYVVVIMIAASFLDRRAVVIAAAASTALTLASYLIAHGVQLEETAPLRLTVSLAAIGITTFLALANLSATADLRRSERHRTNLSRFFSPQLVDQIVEIEVPLSVARYQPAVIMFVDMVGFTAHCSRLSPDAVIAMLRDLLGILSKSVFAHHGTIDKFLGDGLMAVFGSPLGGQCDATNAAACALHMVQAIDCWNDHRRALGEAAIQIAVGIHSGDVVIGDIGSEARFELTVLGDSVNIASRVEAYCRTLDAEILVTAAFMSLVQAEAGNTVVVNFVDQGSHVLRGHLEPIQLYGVSRSAGA